MCRFVVLPEHVVQYVSVEGDCAVVSPVVGWQFALHKYMPAGVEWTDPQGGLFIWLKLQEGLTDHNLYPSAVSRKVAFAPGSLFFPDEKSHQYLRLNFVMYPDEIITEGIRRLGEAISSVLGTTSLHSSRSPTNK